jgi:hypothetical protein
MFSLLLLQAVDKSLNEAVALSTSQASPLLSAGWGLHFISHASSSALLTTSRALLQCVRVWKAANALAGVVQALCYLRIGCASLAHMVVMHLLYPVLNNLGLLSRQNHWRQTYSSCPHRFSCLLAGSAYSAFVLGMCALHFSTWSCVLLVS